jgi:hypothetical protein
VTDGTSQSDRDAKGRFAAGNTGGPGGARKRAFVLKQAAEDAITEEHVGAMIRKAAAMALQGNLSAMRLVLERTSGKAQEAPVEPEPVPIALPRMRTAADCNLAIERVVDGICAGTVERDAARLLIDAIQARLKAIEMNELEERLAQLEKAAERAEERR